MILYSDHYSTGTIIITIYGHTNNIIVRTETCLWYILDMERPSSVSLYLYCLMKIMQIEVVMF